MTFIVRGLYGILNWTVDLFFIGPINAWLVEFLVFNIDGDHELGAV